MKSPFTLFLLSLLALSPVNASERPNVLLIAVDDLNDWVGYLGGRWSKFSLWERTTHVPLVISGPAESKARRTSRSSY